MDSTINPHLLCLLNFAPIKTWKCYSSPHMRTVKLYSDARHVDSNLMRADSMISEKLILWFRLNMRYSLRSTGTHTNVSGSESRARNLFNSLDIYPSMQLSLRLIQVSIFDRWNSLSKSAILGSELRQVSVKLLEQSDILAFSLAEICMRHSRHIPRSSKTIGSRNIHAWEIETSNNV